MEHISKEMLEFIRQQNPKGTRIRLYSMTDDPQPIEGGSLGTLQFIDDMGTFHVKWDNGRTLGLVVGKDSFSTLHPEPSILKLYMPLKADLIEQGQEYDDPIDLDGRDLLPYEGAIFKALRNNQRPEEAESGIMHWYDENDSVNEKVKSVVFTVEARDGQLWGVAECHVSGSLSPEELAILTDFISGQASDGWGEGFEQQELKVGSVILYIHLWNGNDWSIMPEAQRFDPDFSSKLPDMCWSVNEADGSLICIKQGESGFFPSKWSTCDADTNRRLADYYNQKHGITKAQEQAMSVGSMFGWNVPGVNPKLYEGHQSPEMGGMKFE